MSISNNPSTWPTGDLIWTVAQAIARQEGYTGQGNAPFRYNNPGDLGKGDEHGQLVAGYVTLPDGEQLIYFATPEAGWNALYTKLSNILNGASSVYTADMSWAQIGYKWAADPNWAKGVASFLGVDPNSSFSSFFLTKARSAPAQ